MIKNNYIFILIISFVFLSCPCCIPEWMLENGQEIQNFPKWTTSCNAFSSWMNWQSEDGKRLHDLVDDSIISDDFEGKFRIGIQGQNIKIGFNNQKGSFIKLYNWYGEVKNLSDSSVTVEQNDIDTQFIYDCYCKKQKVESSTEKNKSKVEMNKIDENTFWYKQTISEKVIIDCKFYNLAQFCVDLETNRYTYPTDVPLEFCEFFPINFLDEEESFFYFYPIDGSDSYKKIAIFPNDFFKYIYCPEGIYFREINEEKNRISFNLRDAKESDYVDYFEIQVNSKNDVKIHFYRIENEKEILLNTLEKPSIRFEWLNYETGETKIY